MLTLPEHHHLQPTCDLASRGHAAHLGDQHCFVPCDSHAVKLQNVAMSAGQGVAAKHLLSDVEECLLASHTGPALPLTAPMRLQKSAPPQHCLM